MKILLLNDTRVESNPGCHATVGELLKFLKVTVPGSHIDTLSMGMEYENFSDKRFFMPANQKRNIIASVRGLFPKSAMRPAWDYDYPQINYQFWDKHFTGFLSEQFKRTASNHDLIIVNMEGTIHHNSIGGLVLLSMAMYCKQQGKYVFMVNGSYQAMNTAISKSILGSMDFVSVREPLSKAYLGHMGIRASLIPDFAFMSDLGPVRVDCDESTIGRHKCLYTPGVLGAYPGQNGGLSLKSIKRHMTEIRKAGFEPYFLKVEDRETSIEQELNRVNVRTLDANVGAEIWKLGPLLDDFELIITGRYHIGIFGVLRGIKTVFLPSNTFKIEGLLKMIDAQHMMVRGPLKAQKLKKLVTNAKQIPAITNDMQKKFKPFARKLNDVCKQM